MQAYQMWARFAARLPAGQLRLPAPFSKRLGANFGRRRRDRGDGGELDALDVGQARENQIGAPFMALIASR